MDHDFQELEDATISALTPMTAQGLRTLDAYSGQLDVEDLEEITLQFPCIYVVAAGRKLAPNNRYDLVDAEINLIVGDRNVRGARAAARGDVSSPGVYELLRLAKSSLHKVKVHAIYSPFFLTHEAPLVYAPEQSICLYTATYATKAVIA